MQRTRVGFLSDHCRRIEVDYQSGSKQPHSKGCRHFKQLIIFSFNLQTLQLFWYLIDTPVRPENSRHLWIRNNLWPACLLRLRGEIVLTIPAHWFGNSNWFIRTGDRHLFFRMRSIVFPWESPIVYLILSSA